MLQKLTGNFIILKVMTFERYTANKTLAMMYHFYCIMVSYTQNIESLYVKSDDYYVKYKKNCLVW